MKYTAQNINEGIKVLRKVRDFFEEDGSRWTKGAFARKANGKKFNEFYTHTPTVLAAPCFCVAGAIAKLQNENPYTHEFANDPAFRLLADHAMSHADYPDVADLNDKRSTTLPQILNSIDLAILYGRDKLRALKNGGGSGG